jgi:methyl-accepting chemotaxis protein
MNFVHKVAAASSALMLITIGLLTTTQYISVKTSLSTTIEESIIDIVNGVKNTVATELEGKKILANYATTLAEQNPTIENITKIITQPDIKKAFLLAGGGYEIDSPYFKNDSNWNPGADWDPRVRPWYKDAKSKGKLFITEPYTDSGSDEILISVITPLTQGNSFIGSMFFDLSLSGLSDLVNSVKLFEAGYLFIVTEEGTVIAHPESKFNGKKMNSFLPSSSINTQVMSKIELEGEEFNLSFVKIPSQNWYIGVLLDEKIAYQSVYSMRNNVFIYSIVALVISILTLLFLMKKLLLPLDGLNEVIKDVASGNGDLTKRLETETDKEFAELATNFNTFSENLRNQVKQLKAFGVDILQGTVITAEGASESSEAMGSQLQELEMLSTAMNEMATTASDVANNAKNAASATQEAEESTIIGTKIVEKTTSSIEALSNRIEQTVNDIGILEEATGSIETVLQVINDIADQTNLLALNAAIEAARAGEQGRGFAVVADEVRTLASRTQESTTEIRTMIDKLQSGASAVSIAMNASKKAANGTVQQAEKAGEALNQIYGAIKRINDMNIQIASAAHEQSIVAEEINTNTLKIKDLSVQVSDAAQRTNEAIQLQITSVRDQNEILEKFKV